MNSSLIVLLQGPQDELISKGVEVCKREAIISGLYFLNSDSLDPAAVHLQDFELQLLNG
jgi:hypothetical protein